MGDESLFGSMAMPVVVGPILESLEHKDHAAAQTLRAAFSKAEAQHPGFAYALTKGILQRAEMEGQVDMAESLLRLEGMNNLDEFRISRPEEPFRDLNVRATNLKKILSRIPDEIYDRKKFLETIKDIANAIKNLLDAVNSVFVYIHGQQQKQNLELRKRDFVKYSKRFSTTLKDFFRANLKQDVFMSANYLIHQTNLIMQTVKESLRYEIDH